MKQNYIRTTYGTFYDNILSLDYFIKKLLDMNAEAVSRGYENLSFSVTKGYEDEPILEVVGDRPMTPDEIQERKELDEDRRKNDLKRLAFLKAKYEPQA
jgi:hypothetical protein